MKKKEGFFGARITKEEENFVREQCKKAEKTASEWFRDNLKKMGKLK